MLLHCTSSKLSEPVSSYRSLPSAAYVLTEVSRMQAGGCAIVRALEAAVSQAGSHKGGKMGEAVRRKVVGKVIRNLHIPARPNPTQRGPVSGSRGIVILSQETAAKDKADLRTVSTVVRADLYPRQVCRW